VHHTASVPVSRRLVLQLAAGSLAVPALAPAAPPGATLDEPHALLDAYRRIRYSRDGAVCFWWMRAVKYGLVDSQLTPLFGMEIGNFARARTTGPDAFTVTSLEMVFFTDLATGARVTEITNPYTGERIPRGDSLVGPAEVGYSLDGPRYPTGLPGVKFDIEPSHGIFAAEGDDVWLRDDSFTRVTPVAAGAPRFLVTDWTTFHCSRAALAEPAAPSVAATVDFNSVSSWIDWLKMGDRPGSMVTRAVGSKYARLEDMPARFLAILRERQPALAQDPAAALDRPPFSFAP